MPILHLTTARSNQSKMVGVLGLLRWSLRPVDTALLTAGAVAGGLLGLPFVAASYARSGRAALTMSGLWRTLQPLPLGRRAFAGALQQEGRQGGRGCVCAVVVGWLYGLGCTGRGGLSWVGVRLS